MTLFSYHKYNNFILIQEIYTQKYTACTKDEANRIADNNLQSDGISYANGLAQADRCDCLETWSAYASGSFNGQCLSISVSYDNPCGKSKTASFDVYYTRSEPSGDVEYFSISGFSSVGICNLVTVSLNVSETTYSRSLSGHMKS